MGTSLFVADTTNPVSPDQYNTYEQTCNDVDTLRGFVGVTDMQVYLRGFESPGDGGQGPFYWSDTGTIPDDDGITAIIPSSSSVGNGEWIRLPSNISGVQNLTNALNFASGGNIASDATTNIGGASGNNVTVTGTNTITSFGVAQAGTQREVTFAAPLTLTYNATSMILPTGANIVTAAGDTSTWLSLGLGNWINISYQRASGRSLVNANSITAINVQTFTGSGIYTPTNNMVYAIVEQTAGGGGGGSVDASVTAGAGGGGAGGYLRALLTAAQIGVSQAVTINGGGAGGATGGNNTGSAGGNISLGLLLACVGGSGGTGAGAQVSGGAGGSATVTTGVSILAFTGGQGGVGGYASSLGFGGGGGSNPLGAPGGAGLSTGGGPVPGLSAVGYGAGGAGACSGTSSTTQAGGNGSPGVIIITEYISG